MQGTVNVTVQAGGVSISQRMARTADSQSGHEIAAPAAKAGTLNGRVDDNTANILLSSGHGITTGMKLGVFWAGGYQYGVEATVTGNNCAIDNGTGDNLPVNSTAVYAAQEIVVNSSFVGNNLFVLGVGATKRSGVIFCSNATTYDLVLDMAAGEGYSWFSDGAEANPLTNDTITEIHVCSGIDAASTVKIGLSFDGTP